MVVAISTIDFFAHNTKICVGEMEKEIMMPIRLDLAEITVGFRSLYS